jgi:hypothetical protein
MEEISNVSSWGKEKQCVGSYTANIQERPWQVSCKFNLEILKTSSAIKNYSRITSVSDILILRSVSDLQRILRGRIVDSCTRFGFEWDGRR